MAHRDVVVVGASAGGVEALRALVAKLPADVAAAVVVVLHVPRSSPSALPAILARATSIPVRPAVDGELLRHGRIYVAPMDRHVSIIDNRIRLSRGPAENGHRPAIDPLFRSAARAFGPRVVGIVLSGARDDGAAGLAAIADRGGTTIVQDPEDAVFPSMPRAALDQLKPDHVLPVAEIGSLVGELSRTPAEDHYRPDDEDSSLDAEVAMADLAAVTSDELPGDPAGYGCPACGGALFELEGRPRPAVPVPGRARLVVGEPARGAVGRWRALCGWRCARSRRSPRSAAGSARPAPRVDTMRRRRATRCSPTTPSRPAH